MANNYAAKNIYSNASQMKYLLRWMSCPYDSVFVKWSKHLTSHLWLLIKWLRDWYFSKINEKATATRKYYSKNYIYHSMYPLSYHIISVQFSTLMWIGTRRRFCLYAAGLLNQWAQNVDRISLLCRHNSFLHSDWPMHT